MMGHNRQRRYNGKVFVRRLYENQAIWGETNNRGAYKRKNDVMIIVDKDDIEWLRQVMKVGFTRKQARNGAPILTDADHAADKKRQHKWSRQLEQYADPDTMIR